MKFHRLISGIMMILFLSSCRAYGNRDSLVIDECGSDDRRWNLFKPEKIIFDGTVFNGEIWLITNTGLYVISEGNVVTKYNDIGCDYFPGLIYQVKQFNEKLYFNASEGISVYSPDGDWSIIEFGDDFPLADVYNYEVIGNELWVSGLGGVVALDENDQWTYLDWTSNLVGEEVFDLFMDYEGKVHLKTRTGSDITDYEWHHILYTEGQVVELSEPFRKIKIIDEKLAFRVDVRDLQISRDHGENWNNIVRLNSLSSYFVDADGQKVYYTDGTVLYQKGIFFTRKLFDSKTFGLPINEDIAAVDVNDEGKVFILFTNAELLIIDNHTSEDIHSLSDIKFDDEIDEMYLEYPYVFTNKYVYDMEEGTIVHHINEYSANSLTKGKDGMVYFIDGSILKVYKEGEMVNQIEIEIGSQSPFSVITSNVDQNGDYWFVSSIDDCSLISASEGNEKVVDISQLEVNKNEIKIAFDSDNHILIYDTSGNIFAMTEMGFEAVSIRSPEEGLLKNITYDEDGAKWVLWGDYLYQYHNEELISIYDKYDTGKIDWNNLILYGEGLPCVYSSYTVACMMK
jgi:hypothetical protein